jgi:adenylosuccinate lyase
MQEITKLSVLDGRYSRYTEELKDIFSEYGLIKHRVFVEVEWLKFILNDLNLGPLSLEETESVSSIYSGFNKESAMMVKDIEKTTNHDVKAVEYYIKNQLENRGLSKIKEWVHFSCTSEDINNTSYALMVKKGQNLIASLTKELLDKTEDLALTYKSVPMMARTHGQPATPTTVGKEFINFSARIYRELNKLKNIDVECKINGATGSFNAHFFVKPDINWIEASQKFITEKLHAVPLLWTTQINNYHSLSEIFQTMLRISGIVTDLDRDMWGYISINYFKQKTKEGEVGSSTMPHKVNPIDFENSEGNMGIAGAMLEHLSLKLLSSRFQRDLTDSTVLRNIGAAFGYFVIGLKNCLKGLSKIELNEHQLRKDLDNNLELLAEPVQTAMRVFGEENPYEKLKELTRGRKIDTETYVNFIETLEKIPPEFKDKMKTLTPSTYTGLAENLVDLYFKKK